MGIKSLTSVMIDNEYVVAQYTSHDGCPTEIGFGILTFLRDKMKKKTFLKKLKNVRYLTKDEELMVRGKNEEERYKLFPYLDIDGDDLLEFIQKSQGEIVLRDEREFVRDSIFCEYAYVIDLDVDTFEIYMGEQRKAPPKGERFSDLKPLPECPEFHPVRFMTGFYFGKFPTDEEYNIRVKNTYDNLKREMLK